MKDTITTGTVAGILGTIVMHILFIIWRAFGLVKIDSLHVAAALFLNWKQVYTPTGLIIGAIVHIIIGAGGGVILAFIIRFTGKDYYWLKGLALSGLMLLTGMGLVVPLLKIVPQLRTDGLTTLMHVFTFGFYGLTASYIIARYGKITTSET